MKIEQILEEINREISELKKQGYTFQGNDTKTKNQK